jgi:predicted kinase
MSGDVERVAAALVGATVRVHQVNVGTGTGFLRQESATQLAAHLLAPGGVVAGMVAEAREAGVEEGVDSTWHLKQLRAMWEAAARKQGAAEARVRVLAAVDVAKRTVHGRLALADDLRAVLADLAATTEGER